MGSSQYSCPRCHQVLLSPPESVVVQAVALPLSQQSQQSHQSQQLQQSQQSRQSQTLQTEQQQQQLNTSLLPPSAPASGTIDHFVTGVNDN